MAIRKERRAHGELDVTAIRVARLSLGEGLPPEEIVQKLQKENIDVRNVRDVDRLLRRARDPDRPLVAVRLRPVHFHNEIDTQSADSLREKFGLGRATIVKVNLNRNWPSAENSNRLHEMLGMAAAVELHSFLRDGDSIAVSSGRGVGFTVLALKHIKDWHGMEPLANAEIISLSGISTVEVTAQLPDWPAPPSAGGADIATLKSGIDAVQVAAQLPEEAIPPGNLEANSIASRLAAVLGVRQEKVRLVNLPLFHDGKVLSQDIIAKVAPHLSAHINTPIPQVALVGLGAFDRDYRLLRNPHYSDQIRNEVKRLENEIWPSCQDAIAHICYNFFLSNSESVPKGFHEQVREIASQLRSKTVTVQLEKLNQAHERILIAGGPEKFNAIEGLLTGKAATAFRPTWLVTDDLTASNLLATTTDQHP